MGGDGRINQIAAESAETRECVFVVGACKPLAADHVGHQDRRERSGLGHSSGNPALRMPSKTA
jgi:hypothetical protein